MKVYVVFYGNGGDGWESFNEFLIIFKDKKDAVDFCDSRNTVIDDDYFWEEHTVLEEFKEEE